jgi:hypothetical protein
MTEFCNVEVWVVVDDNSFYALGTSRENAVENYVAKVQPLADAAGLRYVRLALTVPLPVAESLTLTVPDVPAVPAVAVQAA